MSHSVTRDPAGQLGAICNCETKACRKVMNATCPVTLNIVYYYYFFEWAYFGSGSGDGTVNFSESSGLVIPE